MTIGENSCRLQGDKAASGPVPAVSVVMPVHDGMPFVDAGIASVLKQDFSDFELVVGDDGSRDGTAAVCARWAARDPRVRVVTRATKSGLSASANWVIGHARAPLIAVAHADDLSHPTRLRRQVDLFEAHRDVVLIGAVAEGIDARGRVVHPPNLWRLRGPSIFAAFAHSLAMYRRDAFDAVGGYREAADYWEDIDLFWRLARRGRVLVLTSVEGQYRHSPVSVRNRDDQDRLDDAADRAYRAAALIGAGQDPDVVLTEPSPARISPRIFIAKSWIRVWAGQRSPAFVRLMRRGRLGFDRGSLVAIAFVGWAAVAPRSLRYLIQQVMRVRNRAMASQLAGRDHIEWQPFAGAADD